MKRVVASIACIMFMAAQAFAGSESYAFERIVVTSSGTHTISSSLVAQPSNSAPPCGGLVSVENETIRFTLDGTAVTTSTGHVVTAGNSFNVDSWQDLRNLKMKATSETAVASVTLYRGCSR